MNRNNKSLKKLPIASIMETDKSASIKSVNLPIYKPKIIKKYRRPIMAEYKSAFKGFLKTYRIKGQLENDEKYFF